MLGGNKGSPRPPKRESIGKGRYKITSDEIDKVRSDYKASMFSPQKNTMFSSNQFTTRSYLTFKQEQFATDKTVIDRAYIWAGGFLDAGCPDDLKGFLNEHIKMAQMKVTAEDIFALGMIVLMISLIIPFFVMAIPVTKVNGVPKSIGQASGLVGLGSIIIPVVLSGLVIAYPVYRASLVKVRIAGCAPMAVLYIVIFLRSSPSLESAIAFSARNVPGPLGAELRALQWGIATRQYTTAENALIAFSEKVSNWAPGIADAFYLIAGSANQPTQEKRLEMLNRAVSGILSTTRHTMQVFGRSLQMPTIVVNALGILLPVMGLVMAPIVTIMLSEGSGTGFTLAFIYDVVLPGIILLIITVLGSRKPGSFSRIDVSQHPDSPPPGVYYLDVAGKRISIPMLPFAVILFVTISAYSFIFLITEYGPGANTANVDVELQSKTRSFHTIPLILAIALSVGTYCYGLASQRMAIRERIRETEAEFSDALYQLGNIMNQGQPFEIAVGRAAKIMTGSVIEPFFLAISRNINELGMPLKSAIYDRKYGALRYLPSDLVANVLEIVTESTQRGVMISAKTAMNISTYLKNVKEVEEEIEGMLSESMSSMKFQAYLLAPVVCGIIVGLSQMIITILAKVAMRTKESFGGGVSGADGLGMAFNTANAIPPDLLQVIVGIYIVELLTILGLFLAILEYGPEDDIAKFNSIGLTVIIGTVVYVGVTVATSMVFGGMATMLA